MQDPKNCLLDKWCVLVAGNSKAPFEFHTKCCTVKSLIDNEFACMEKGITSGWSCCSVVDTYKDACDTLKIIRKKYDKKVVNDDNVW